MKACRERSAAARSILLNTRGILLCLSAWGTTWSFATWPQPAQHLLSAIIIVQVIRLGFKCFGERLFGDEGLARHVKARGHPLVSVLLNLQAVHAVPRPKKWEDRDRNTFQSLAPLAVAILSCTYLFGLRNKILSYGSAFNTVRRIHTPTFQ
jgi:hypothetical protein